MANETGSAEDPQVRRKLVAILYADMVGYSRLIGLDDAGTLHRLKKLRQDLIDPAIEEHAGGIVQTGGDSLLIVFDSIDGTVPCGLKFSGRFRLSMRTNRPTEQSAFAWG